MKFVVTVTALLTALGACVAENRSPDDVAVYELNSRASDRIPTVLGEDALMYLADKRYFRPLSGGFRLYFRRFHQLEGTSS